MTTFQRLVLRYLSLILGMVWAIGKSGSATIDQDIIWNRYNDEVSELFKDTREEVKKYEDTQPKA